MKQIEYSISDLITNLKQNKKRMLLIFIVLMLISLVASFILSRSYNQGETEKDDTVVSQIDLEAYSVDESYFYEVNFELKTKVDALDAYAQYLHQVDLNGNNSEQLVEFQQELSDYNELFDSIRQYYILNGPIFADDWYAAESFVNKHIDELKKNIDSVESESNQLSERIFISSADRESEEQELSDHILGYKSELKMWEKQRDNLENNDNNEEKLISINESMDEMLRQGVTAYNNLAVEFNDMISNFEDEQYDIVYNPYLLDTYNSLAGITGELDEEDIINVNKNSALIYARSVAGLDNNTERFFACLTFGILLSLGLSVLYGLFGRRKIDEDTK